jgi:T5SS/PEP-CTERM-associated repeat protein
MHFNSSYRRVSSACAIFAAAFLSLAPSFAFGGGETFDGSGTYADPYILTSANLESFNIAASSDYLIDTGKYYKVTGDISNDYFIIFSDTTSDNYLTILSAFSTHNFYVGYSFDTVNKPTFSGDVTVAGSGASLACSYELELGYGYTGTASLTVSDGALVSTPFCTMSYGDNSQSTLTVTGQNSRFTNTGRIDIGECGSGTLKVENGGQVTTGNSGSDRATVLGSEMTTATGMATVSGNDLNGTASRWTVGGEFDIGQYGSGNLTIENGGIVECTSVSYGSYIGRYSESNGSVTVTGAGSQWLNTGIIHFGAGDSTTLQISDGALVETGGLSFDGANGVVYINGGYLAVVGELDDKAITTLLSGIKVGTISMYADAELNGNITCTYFSLGGIVDNVTGYSLNGYTVFYETVPEPASLALFGGFGALALVLVRRRISAR